MPHEVETMVSARTLPWHRLGNVAPDVMTAKEAIDLGGLGWKVDLWDTYIKDPQGNELVVPGRKAVVRLSDYKPLGSVGSHYVPFQNDEAFSFMDTLVQSGAAKYETAGSLRGGKIIFLTMKVPKNILIGGEDAHELYILLRTSHDGTKAISVFLTMIRVVCMNTLTLATWGGNVKHKWSVTHVSTVHGRLAEARDTLRMTEAYTADFQKKGDRLLKTKMTDSEVEQVLTRVLPDRPKTPDTIKIIINMYKNSPTTRYQGTAWGVLNAITEYHDHVRRSTSAEALFLNTIDGVGAKYRNSAAALMLAKG